MVAHHQRAGGEDGLDGGVAERLVADRGHEDHVGVGQVRPDVGGEAEELHAVAEAGVGHGGAQLLGEPLVAGEDVADDA